MKLFETIKLTFTQVEEIKKLSTYPFYCEDKCLMYVNKQEKCYFARAISKFFSVTRITRDMETGIYSDDLSICTSFGEKTVSVFRSVFSKKNFQELNQHGLQYDNGAISLLLKYIVISECQAPSVTKYKSVGWVQQEQEGTKFFGLSLMDSFQYVGEKDLTSIGSLNDYVAGVNRLVVGHAGLEISLATSLSAAVIGLLSTQQPMESLMIHFFGTSSCGKTTALQLAASVWGNPEMGKGILSSWNATDNALLTKLNNNYGVVACFDESSSMQRDFSKIIYAISQNTGKARLSKDCQLQKERKFCTSIISSGENSLLAASNKNAGLRARLLEFFNAPLTENAEHSDSIKQFVKTQHGTLGAEFVTALASQKDSVANMMRKWEKKLKKELTGECILEDRLIFKYAIILLTASIACDQLGVHFDLGGMEKCLISHYRSLAFENNLGMNAYDQIMEWLVKNASHIMRKNYLPANTPVEGIFLPGNKVALLKGTFEKILHDGGFTDTKVVAQELKRLNLLIPESQDRLTARVVINGLKAPCYRLKVNSEVINWLNAQAEQKITGDDLEF